jgi:hypothetical protein
MNFLKLNVVDTLPPVTSADAGARVLFEDSIYVVTSAGAWKEVSPDKGFLEYRAVVSQDLTENPTAVVRKNELGVEITFTRLDTGVYQVGGIPSNSDVTISKNTISSQIGINITIGYVSSENIFYSNVGGSLADSVINEATLTIRKYPD